MLLKRTCSPSHTKKHLKFRAMNKGHLFSSWLELMGFFTVSYPLDHALFLLRPVTWERLDVVNGLMEAKCALSLESDDISAWMTTGIFTRPILLTDDLSTWLGCLDQRRRETAGLFLHVLLFSLLLEFYSSVIFSTFFSSAVLSKSQLSTCHSKYNFFLPHGGYRNYQWPPPTYTCINANTLPFHS